jgi:hypothetical protein
MPRAPIAGERGSQQHRARQLDNCWHGKIAWRVKSGAELAVAAEITREEHRAMLEYVNEMESVMRSAKSLDARAAPPSPDIFARLFSARR